MLITEAHFDQIIRRAKEFGATKVVVFGSVLEMPNIAHDLDIATDVPLGRIDEFAGVLEHDLHCVVDAVPLQRADHPFIQYVLHHGRQIL